MQTRISHNLNPAAALDAAARAVSHAGYSITSRGSAAFVVPLFVSLREIGGAHFDARVRVARDGSIVVSSDADAKVAAAPFSPFGGVNNADDDHDARWNLRRDADEAVAAVARIVVSTVTADVA